jgi:hypothetical protein
MRYLLSDVPSISAGATYILENGSIYNRTLRLVCETPITLKIPEGERGNLAFQGRITTADLEFLKILERTTEIIMRVHSLQNSQGAPLGVLLVLHRCIEQAEIELHEDEFVKSANRLCLYEEILTTLNVMDLAADEHDCNICIEAYIPTKGDRDREEEIPCRLPCGYIFGKACLIRYFCEMHVTYPKCRARFDPSAYGEFIEPEEVVSPW